VRRPYAQDHAAARELRHISVVRLLDIFEDEEYVHVVTELCEGGELFNRILEKSNDNGGVRA